MQEGAVRKGGSFLSSLAPLLDPPPGFRRGWRVFEPGEVFDVQTSRAILSTPTMSPRIVALPNTNNPTPPTPTIPRA
jgi:hypothetical protein